MASASLLRAAMILTLNMGRNGPAASGIVAPAQQMARRAALV
jgi:hypothetical protein